MFFLRSAYLRGFHISRLAVSRTTATDSKQAIWTQEKDNGASSSQEKNEEVSDASGFGTITAYETEEALINDDLKTEKDVEKLITALKKLDEGAAVVGSGLVKDPTRKLRVEEMESPDDTLSRPLNQWRKVIYDEGELDKSNLSLPPSRTNPHPFDGSFLPPTHARSMAAYANHSKVLQNLLDLGVDLLDIDTKTKLSRHFVRMNWEKDVRPKLSWLVKEIGVDSATLGSYITRNPFFLIQNLNDLIERRSYLESKKFSKRQIAKIVIEHRYWLNTDIKTIDSRLGWIQRQFNLSGDEVRKLITKEPRILIFGLGPIQRLVLLFHKELRFSKGDIKKMLVNDPRLFMMDFQCVLATFNYLVLVMDIPNYLIVNYPLVLRCPVSTIRRRHEFLKRLNKAIYDPELPGYVSLENLLQPSDRKFANNIAKVKLADYNSFMKTL